MSRNEFFANVAQVAADLELDYGAANPFAVGQIYSSIK
jgi:hypothetical protein